MGLIQTIDAEIKQAMLSKNEGRLRALRGIKSALLLAKTEKGNTESLSEDIEMKILQKLAKQRRESADIYKTQNRDDLYQAEIEELSVIEAFLPKQLSPEEIKKELSKIIAESGVSSPAEMGKVMGIASKALAGKADGKLISSLLKELLSA